MNTNTFENYIKNSNINNIEKLMVHYRDWIQIQFQNLENNIINKHITKKEFQLLKIFKKYKHITKASVTFKTDGVNKKLNKFVIHESTNEHLLNEWLSFDGQVTTIKNNGIIQGISRIIKGKF